MCLTNDQRMALEEAIIDFGVAKAARAHGATSHWDPDVEWANVERLLDELQQHISITSAEETR